MAEKREKTLRLLQARKQHLFLRIQRLYDLSKGIEEKKVAEQFIVLVESLPQTLEEFEKCELRIQELEIELKEDFVPTFNDAHLDLVAFIKQASNKLRQLAKSEVVVNPTMSSRQSSPDPNLPRIELPTFDGNQLKWASFYELFKVLVHDNKALTDQQRIQYLFSRLSGEATSLIQHVTPVADNYQIIWTALVNRYQDTRAQTEAYLKQIFEFKGIRVESRCGLTAILDQFCAPITALKRLRGVDLTDIILLYHALKLLDPISRRAFEAAVRDKDTPSYDDLVSFIQKQIKSMPFDDNKVVNSPGNWSKKTQPPSKNFKAHSYSNSKVFVTHSSGNDSSSNRDKAERGVSCLRCSKKGHKFDDCSLFLKQTPRERYGFVKGISYCFRCLKGSHSSRNCKSDQTCSLCNLTHHTLLHFGSTESKAIVESNVNAEKNLSVTCYSATNSNNSVVLLSTAGVLVKGSSGRLCELRVLLDSGSQSHFITSKACKKLNLPISKLNTVVHGFGGKETVVRGRTLFSFQSKIDSDVCFSVESLVVDSIVERMPSCEIDRSQLAHLDGLQLADEKFYSPSAIDAIIGAELLPHLLKSNRVVGKLNEITAVDSLLGYILMGRAPVVLSSSDLSCHIMCNLSLDNMVKKFWELEECPTSTRPLTPQEVDCEKNYVSSVRRTESGRFIVSMSWSKHPDNLGDSYHTAKRRFLNLERRLESDSTSRVAYHEILKDYLKQGHMSLITDQSDRSGYHIPHHAIVKTSSLTTPIRIVFDASAKTTTSFSLNELLHVGPKLQTDIFVVLLNFRLFQIALTADIRQMYRQIVMEQSCRRYQRILWRFSVEDPIEIYELNCVVFGVSSSPHLALRTVHRLVEEEGNDFPVACTRIPSDMFVDDLVTSAPSVSDANDLYSQTKDLFKRGGFELTKWASNSTELIEHMQENDMSVVSKNFDLENSLSILGLRWQPVVDSFHFVVHPAGEKATKRKILSAVARIYDPLGFLAPLTLLLKCLIKELWQHGVGWDQTPPVSIIKRWEICQKEFDLLSNISIPRHLGVFSNTSISLIGFCDASLQAFGAVVYLKSQRDDGSPPTITLLCGKSKVAPNKSVSIPRLELCAALLLAELLHTIHNHISERCRVSRVIAFSDSTVTLYWMRAPPSRWTTFVANRVSKIQDCHVQQWKHVISSENPSDCLSRGLTPAELVNHRLWWNGPTWLEKEEDSWPVKVDFVEVENPPEARTNVLTTLHTDETCNNVIYSLILRCSSYQRLLRVVIVILKFVRVLPKQGESDLNVAEMYLCRLVQEIHFATEFSQLKTGKCCSVRMQRLSPFIEKELIRVGGRLSAANLDFDDCHPIILPKNDHFVTLLVNHFHIKNCHAGPRLLLSLIRQRFWILSGRLVVRKCVYLCNKCFRCKPKVLPPKMGNLPASRVTQLKPFEHCGVDYAGPIRITMAKRRNPVILKAYICLFVCMSTKAVHIELVSDLSTPAFLAAFRRFLSRRGPCRVIYSDCGTNFVGAHEQLVQLSNFVNSSEFQTSLTGDLSDYRVDWKFIPPGAPHFGGIWEANIKAAKSHLFRVIGIQLLTYEEMNTVLIQVEAVLNSRPLCSMSEDPSEPLALTPAHFLKLTPLQAFPMKDVVDCPVNRLTRYQLVDQLVQSFWRRWRVEYLNELQERGKWWKSPTPLVVGTVVVVDQPNLPPLQWPLGIVDQVYPGSDGQVRVALVRLKNGCLKRPATKLFPLPTQ